MVLGFKQYYPGTSKPTDFVEKIGKGIKIHSLREDENNRWKVGILIHMAIGVRTPKYFCFNDSHICTALQPVYMVYDSDQNRLSISVKGRRLKPQQITMFIANDGFDNRQDFIQWFFPDNQCIWQGKIIHWSPFKY